MLSIKDLAEKIQSIGFRCVRCGTCCRHVSPDSNLVLVSPDEIKAIISSTGLTWDKVAEPYPETIDDHHGARFTIGWCLRRNNDHCRFFHDGACTIYQNRPWICQTYPFMLDENRLVVSPCEGLGQTISEKDALIIASKLLERQSAEKVEEERVRQVLKRIRISSKRFVVIDSEEMKEIDSLDRNSISAK